MNPGFVFPHRSGYFLIMMSFDLDGKTCFPMDPDLEIPDDPEKTVICSFGVVTRQGLQEFVE